MVKKEILTKLELKDHITWGNCGTHCKGGQHVGRNCSYIIGEVRDLNLMVKFDGSRSTLKNKEVVLDALYDLYLKY
jgi:hypothetical protein